MVIRSQSWQQSSGQGWANHWATHGQENIHIYAQFRVNNYHNVCFFLTWEYLEKTHKISYWGWDPWLSCCEARAVIAFSTV